MQIFALILQVPNRCSSVGSVEDLITGGRCSESPILAIFFPRIDDSHCDRIHFSLAAAHCFDDVYVGKRSVAWKEYCAEYWLKELQETMDRCIDHHNNVESGLKHRSINQPIN